MNGNLVPVDSRGVVVETDNIVEQETLNRSELDRSGLLVCLWGLDHRRRLRLVSRRQSRSVVALVIRHCGTGFADDSLL